MNIKPQIDKDGKKYYQGPINQFYFDEKCEESHEFCLAMVQAEIAKGSAVDEEDAKKVAESLSQNFLGKFDSTEAFKKALIDSEILNYIMNAMNQAKNNGFALDDEFALRLTEGIEQEFSDKCDDLSNTLDNIISFSKIMKAMHTKPKKRKKKKN